MNEITFSLINNDLTPNGGNAYNADINQVSLIDVIIQNQPLSDQNNAFRFNTHKKQSHSFNPHSINPTEFISQKNNNSLAKLRKSELVSIPTQNDPTNGKLFHPLQKSFRATNKKPSLQMEINDPSPKMLVNSSLQTVFNQQRTRSQSYRPNKT